MILGHQKQIDYLKKILDSGKIPHALLFSGQRGLGKKKIALEFISWIFGESPLSHPDFILIEPISQQIQIDQIRDLNWKTSLKPIKAKMKAAIINSAHLMTKEAQNCFLKTLEEPKGNALIILISEYPHWLLPTILSRCQTIKFFPVKRKVIEDYLKEKGLKSEKINKILEISLGRPEIVISLAENPEKLKEIENLERDLEKIPKTTISLRFQYLKEILKRYNLSEILEIWTVFFRKIFLSSFDKKSIQILKEIQKIDYLILSQNIDQRLALENLILKL
jgi:DNA polymerase-3 subunit delta'